VSKESNKKELEFEILSEFKSRFSGFPPGEIIWGEQPDFIIESAQSRIGIEITEINTPDEANQTNLRQQESIAEQIIQLASDCYQELDKGQFSVTVVFSLEKPLAEKKKDKIAAFICEFAKCNKLFHETHNGLIPEIHRISIWRDPSPAIQKWTALYSGWIGKLNCEILTKVIEKKEMKIKTYEKLVLHNWLLIVANGKKLSGSFNYDDMKSNCDFNSNFSKVFLYNRFQGQVFELK